MITSFNSSQVFQIKVWLLLLKELQNTVLLFTSYLFQILSNLEAKGPDSQALRSAFPLINKQLREARPPPACIRHYVIGCQLRMPL